MLNLMHHSNMTSFIGYMNNAMIKFSMYFTSHVCIVRQIMDIISKCSDLIYFYTGQLCIQT